MSSQATVPPLTFDVIRALIAALINALSTDSTDQGLLAAAQQQNAALTQQVVNLTSEDADLGTPLNTDEQAQLQNVLNQVAALPPSSASNAVPAKVPAAAPAVPTTQD